jgi:hypothetical protein
LKVLAAAASRRLFAISPSLLGAFITDIDLFKKSSNIFEIPTFFDLPENTINISLITHGLASWRSPPRGIQESASVPTVSKRMADSAGQRLDK